MALYNIDLDLSDTNIAKLSFGDPASNVDIVRFVNDIAVTDDVMDSLNGNPLFINGPASLPIAFVLAHKWAHLFPSIWIYDPKLGGYVCCISHEAGAEVGDFACLS